MPIRVKCEQCKKTLSVKDHLAGKKIKCPVCQSPVTVGAASPAGGPPVSADSSSSNPDAPKSAAPTATKKPAVLGKPVAKPTQDRSKTNGTADPTKNGASSPAAKNGTPTPPVPPESIDRPPEHAEAEALAAFSEELKPKEEEGPPKTIDFTCEWCEQELHLPLDQGGKQIQCPNLECKRIIKVPMPKIEAKKDWRKMDRVGPAAALVNQPEQPTDAWSSQNVTKARQDSLAKAGALVTPPKPKRDATAWLFLAFWSILGAAFVVLAGTFIRDRIANSMQHKEIDELKRFVDPNYPKKIDNKLLSSEAKRVLALLYLRETKGAILSERHMNGVTVDFDEKAAAVNEQLFLLAKAHALIEQGGDDKEVEVDKTRRKWSDVYGDLTNALGKIRDGELQAVAAREIISRLIEKKKLVLAQQLAGTLAGDAANPVMSQKIALSVLNDEQEAIKEFAENLPQPPLETEALEDANIRNGFAEGYARKGEFDKAAKVALTGGGTDKDRIEACLGVASIALAAKKKEEATKCVKEALKLSKDAADLTDWNLLELLKLAARTDEIEAAKDIAEKVKPEFKTRAHLEIFLAKCELATGRIAASDLADLEASATKDDYVPLALAWEELARRNAKLGASRNDNLKTFDAHIKGTSVPPEIREYLRQMVDVGTYLGSMK